MSNNIITFYTASVPGNGFIQQLYQQMIADPPAGYSVLQHQSMEELCGQASAPGNLLGSLEIIAHGTPLALGPIAVNNIAQLATALKKASPITNVYLSGCNTGTWIAGTNNFSITAYLGRMVTCKVYGSQGYVNSGTMAKGDIQCSRDDWGQSKNLVYGGSTNANGFNVFTQRGTTPFPYYAVPFPPQSPISINDPKLTAVQRSVLTNLIGPLMSTPNQNVPLNPMAGPTYCISSGADIFDVFLGDTSVVVRREANGFTWSVTPSASDMKTLSSVNMPVAATAVVATPEAAPKVQA